MTAPDPYWTHDGPAGCQAAEIRLSRVLAAVQQHQRLNPGPGADMLLRKVVRIINSEDPS